VSHLAGPEQVAVHRPDAPGPGPGRRPRPDGTKSRVLLIEDEHLIRESLGDVLEEEGYSVSFAENGHEALRHLRDGILPHVILLDLRMPVMDGWEFRAIQKNDPKLSLIPVVAISADGSAPAVTISAEAYLRKPLDVNELLHTIDRIVFESEWNRMAARLEEAERLASLGRLAAGVGHEINNPLAFAILSVGQALAKLGPPGPPPSAIRSGTDPRAGLAPGESQRSPAGVREMLEDCQVGLERIRQIVGNLQRLSRQGHEDRGALDIHKVIEESVAMAWNQVRHRARLAKHFGKVPLIQGDATALGQVFLNLLVNAAQAIPEGNAEQNEISICTRLDGDQLVVEIRDTGKGIPAQVLPHVFEPFFTTKPPGLGTGLGLSISLQTVTDHGGRLEVESQPTSGSVFRVLLPAVRPPVDPAARSALATDGEAPRQRGRVLVIDDEPLIGRVIQSALSSDHDVVSAQRASDAFARLEAGETFDLVLCDVVMPDISGPQVYAMIARRWPHLIGNLVFMTGGAFTPGTLEFIDRQLTPVLRKPFRVDDIKNLIRERMQGDR
jgi:two-component system cell cycle sensor histidine kinase/response regulator CckA